LTPWNRFLSKGSGPADNKALFYCLGIYEKSMGDVLIAGYIIGIITGGIQKRVRLRYQRLGVCYFYDDVKEKLSSFSDFLESKTYNQKFFFHYRVKN